MQSPEERFYSRHSATLPVGHTLLTEKDFEKGKRYFICRDSLNRQAASRRSLLVELGCGAGERLSYLKDNYRFVDAIGVDLGFAADARTATGRFLPANLNNPWPLAGKSVDVLIAMMLFEHLFDPFFCFEEVARVLHPEGRAFVNLPLVTSFRNRMRLLCGRLPNTSVPYSKWLSDRHWDGFHLHYFSIASIHDLAAESGLSVVSAQAVGRAKWLKDALPSLLCGEISFELRLKTGRLLL